MSGLITGKDREIQLPDSVSYPEILRLLIIALGLWLSLYNLMHIGEEIVGRTLAPPESHLTQQLIATRIVNIVGGLGLILAARKISAVIYTAPDSWVEGIDRLGSENFIALICVGAALLVFLFMLL